MLRDDGVVIYVNGIEVLRNNMPSGTITSTTLATSASDNGTQIISTSLSIAASHLIAGVNTISVEVHQTSGNSSDLIWDMRLTGSPVGSTSLIRGPYIQNVTSASATIRWRTNVPAGGKLLYGTDPNNLNFSNLISTSSVDHSIQLTGLAAGTKYFYSVETEQNVLQRSELNYFKTNQ